LSYGHYTGQPLELKQVHIATAAGRVNGALAGKELWDFVGAKFDFLKRLTTELYILRSELSQRKLSPTLATAHYSSPDNAIGLVAQCELSGYVKLG